MDEGPTMLALLRQSADARVVESLETLIESGPDHRLNRVNVLDFAARSGLDEEDCISTFLHASRIGLFDLSWNVLCPGCGGVLDANATLRTLDRTEYHCALCAVGYEPTLDEMVEVTFTVSPRVRHIAAHDPDSLSLWEYARQIFWGSGFDLPEDAGEEVLDEVILASLDLQPGEKGVISLNLPEKFIIVFDPVTHATQFIEASGEPTRERQQLSLVFDPVHTHSGTMAMKPGPLRLSLENKTARRVLPGVWVADDQLHKMLERRKPFLTAKRLLTNQTFRDLYRTDTLDVDQRLKITSLTFLFTDLKGSTALYERVGDLVAFDLVKEHFRLLLEIVAAEAGAVVKTIGDAVMATFPTPDRAVTAALRMREAMRTLNADRGREDLLLNIGLHEGPCLAVMLNDRQDYFGQTVNVASRVQGLADSQSIFTTDAVVRHPEVARLLEEGGLEPKSGEYSVKGITDRLKVYEIP